MSQWWRAVGNTVSDLTGPRFEPQTSRTRKERVIPLDHLDVAKVYFDSFWFLCRFLTVFGLEQGWGAGGTEFRNIISV